MHTRSGDRTPNNLVARALYMRIGQAIKEGQKFRVVIVLPVRHVTGRVMC